MDLGQCFIGLPCSKVLSMAKQSFFSVPAPGTVTRTGNTTFIYNHAGQYARSLSVLFLWSPVHWKVNLLILHMVQTATVAGKIQWCLMSELCFQETDKGWESGTGQFSGLSQCCIILKKPCSRTGIRDCAWELPSAKTTMKIYRLGENILTY